MQQDWPRLPGVTSELEFLTDLFQKLCKDDMHRDDIGIHTIHARRIDDVGIYAPKATVYPSADVICHEPPHVSEDVWPRRNRHPMPLDLAKIYVFDAFAVEMDFVCIGETLDLFCHASFSSVTLV
jgi:hypothetical protein